MQMNSRRSRVTRPSQVTIRFDKRHSANFDALVIARDSVMSCIKSCLDCRQQTVANGFFCQIHGASCLSDGLNHFLRFVVGESYYRHLRKLRS